MNILVKEQNIKDIINLVPFSLNKKMNVVIKIDKIKKALVQFLYVACWGPTTRTWI